MRCPAVPVRLEKPRNLRRPLAGACRGVKATRVTQPVYTTAREPEGWVRPCKPCGTRCSALWQRPRKRVCKYNGALLWPPSAHGASPPRVYHGSVKRKMTKDCERRSTRYTAEPGRTQSLRAQGAAGCRPPRGPRRTSGPGRASPHPTPPPPPGLAASPHGPPALPLPRTGPQARPEARCPARALGRAGPAGGGRPALPCPAPAPAAAGGGGPSAPRGSRGPGRGRAYNKQHRCHAGRAAGSPSLLPAITTQSQHWCLQRTQ
ncbi:translation initiation factor IF-2-like [Falco biarmicus]|uniref:translation initiation factor IF-2-like n=1 Tax=Falco cherrug TaxID=345164 RepID=UPI0024784497|nr:translation initiation factor IF-2-like [Falco cherrug]XP_055667040.1 translation initiation factor IF-2-like [Falco peregrinus]XP_056203754.1 translation initiation factor IF-2-like [Falco biarmicus]